MFQFSGLASLSRYCIFNAVGCPIRKSADVTIVCISPQLIAAYHVLHRLSEPRHPPCALSCFKKFEIVFVTRPLTSDQPKTWWLENYVIDTRTLSSNNFSIDYPICQRTLKQWSFELLAFSCELLAFSVCRCSGYEPVDQQRFCCHHLQVWKNCFVLVGRLVACG